jgi:hypothetical protein
MEHPYRNRPATAFWRSAVAGAPGGVVEPVTELPFTLSPADAVATAGSCFAQHISRHLRARGWNTLRTEAPPEAEAGAEGYALFSANYGNIYTARHLRRLFEEAFGHSEPLEVAWRRPDGAFVDALRPRLSAAGFASREAVAAAREEHLAAVRAVFEGCDVLVLTLGLVEAWMDRRDGTAWPLAPGIVAAPEEAGHAVFHQSGFAEVREDLFAFLDALREVNEAARVVLTVSPVPLAATGTGAHVLAASSYGKAVLRAVAEEAARRPGVAYFPSYEMVTGPHAAGRAFGPDLRSVRPEMVAEVMAAFERHVMGGAPGAAPARRTRRDGAYAALLGTVCDEDALDPDAV